MKLLTAAISLALALACISVGYRIGHREGVRQGHREYQVFVDIVSRGGKEHVNIGDMDCVAVDQLPPGHRP